MSSAMLNEEFEMNYDVSFRENQSRNSERENGSKDKFRTQARYARGGNGRVMNGAHRRRSKVSYL